MHENDDSVTVESGDKGNETSAESTTETASEKGKADVVENAPVSKSEVNSAFGEEDGGKSTVSSKETSAETSTESGKTEVIKDAPVSKEEVAAAFNEKDPPKTAVEAKSNEVKDDGKNLEAVKNDKDDKDDKDDKANAEKKDAAKEIPAELTKEEKETIKKDTGWSDEIVNSTRSVEEAEIYKNANLKEIEINGKKCLVRDDIDMEQKDEFGKTNHQRMQEGKAPLSKDGEIIELHHIGQKQDSPLAELTTQEHRGKGNDTVLHDKQKETEIDRSDFAKERKEHWESRAENI